MEKRDGREEKWRPARESRNTKGWREKIDDMAKRLNIDITGSLGTIHNLNIIFKTFTTCKALLHIFKNTGYPT